MNFWEFIAKWAWPILWLVFALTLYDAWHDHRELSQKIAASEGEEKKRSVRRRILKWAIPILAFVGAVVAQIGSDLSDAKIGDLEAKTAPRSLSVEQQEIIQQYSQGSYATIYFVINDTVPDGMSYANSISHCLARCGYTIIPSASNFSPTRFNVTIEPNDMPEVVKLKEAFRKAHVPVEDGPAFGTGIGNIISRPSGTIMITVGARYDLD